MARPKKEATELKPITLQCPVTDTQAQQFRAIQRNSAELLRALVIQATRADVLTAAAELRMSPADVIGRALDVYFGLEISPEQAAHHGL